MCSRLKDKSYQGRAEETLRRRRVVLPLREEARKETILAPILHGERRDPESAL